MKRTLGIILALSLLASSMLLLSGCGVAGSAIMLFMNDAKKAEFLSALSDRYYSDGVEVKTTMISSTETEASGVTVTAETESITKETLINANDKEKFAHRVEETVKSVTRVGDNEAEEEDYKRTTGYADGFMYLTNDREPLKNGETRIKSESDVDEYIEYLLMRRAVTPEFDPIEACDNVKVEKNGEKTQWTITCSELKEDAAESLQELLLGDLSGIADGGITIDEFNGSVIVSTKTKAVEKMQMSITLTVSIEKTKITANLTCESVYSLPQKDADLTPDGFDEYTLTGDISKLIRVQHFLNEVMDSDGMSLIIKRSEQGRGTNYSETSKVKYGEIRARGKYAYRIESSVDSGGTAKVIITYDGSMQKIRLANMNELFSNETQSEKEARKFIRSLFAGIEFDFFAQNEVTVTETEEGKAKFSIKLDLPEKILKALTDKGETIKDITIKRMDLTVTYDADGNIEKIYYYVNVKGRFHYVTMSVSVYDFSEINILGVG